MRTRPRLTLSSGRALRRRQRPRPHPARKSICRLSSVPRAPVHGALSSLLRNCVWPNLTILPCCSLLPSGLDRRRPCLYIRAPVRDWLYARCRAVSCSIAVFAPLWTLRAVHAFEPFPPPPPPEPASPSSPRGRARIPEKDTHRPAGPNIHYRTAYFHCPRRAQTHYRGLFASPTRICARRKLFFHRPDSNPLPSVLRKQARVAPPHPHETNVCPHANSGRRRHGHDASDHACCAIATRRK